MLLTILRSGLTGMDLVLTLVAYLISTLVTVILVLPFHEFAHAFAADKLGDPSPRYSGRLTLKPFAHIDWIGALMILVVGFGWAKPVQVNMNNFDKPKRDMALVAAAGPLSNLLVSFVSALLLGATTAIYIKANDPSEAAYIIYLVFANIFNFLMSVNVTLAIFNLIPIPPLDGSRVLTAFLPNRAYYKMMQLERYFSIIIIILCVSGALSGVLGKATDGVCAFMLDISYRIFGLI